jgi:hypothetical protein
MNSNQPLAPVTSSLAVPFQCLASPLGQSRAPQAASMESILYQMRWFKWVLPLKKTHTDGLSHKQHSDYFTYLVTDDLES